MEPTVVHDDPVTQNGALLAPESSMGTDGNQQQALNESRKVTLLLKLVPEEVLPQEQPQKHILESYLKELLGVPSEEQPAAESAGETEGREAAPEPGPLTSTACSTPTTCPQCSRRLGLHGLFQEIVFL
ncbi:unnamed protein product [Caretta caretta]